MPPAVKNIDCMEEDGPTGLEVIAGNVDLLTQILLRLPVRSLLRFKSVSKPWLSLISSPKFCVLKSQQYCCKHISGLLLQPYYLRDPLGFYFVPLDHGQPAPFQRLDFFDSGGYSWKLQSFEHSNGLLLCQFESRHTKHYVITGENKHSVPVTKYYVVNPSTKQHTAISFDVKESADKGLRVYSVALAFDPRKSPHFKLIFLFHRDFHSDGLAAEYCVQIYSSETGLFTQCSDLFRTSISNFKAKCCFWNGAINWICGNIDGLYFNVDEERFGILPAPPFNLISYYAESNDHLYLVQTKTCADTQFDVYEMDRQYSGWFVKFNVDLQPMFRAFPTKKKRPYPYPYGAFNILAIVDKDDDGDSFIVFARICKPVCKIIRFDLKDRVFTHICDLPGVDDVGWAPHLYGYLRSVQFLESLHPL